MNDKQLTKKINKVIKVKIEEFIQKCLLVITLIIFIFECFVYPYLAQLIIIVVCLILIGYIFSGANNEY